MQLKRIRFGKGGKSSQRVIVQSAGCCAMVGLAEAVGARVRSTAQAMVIIRLRAAVTRLWNRITAEKIGLSIETPITPPSSTLMKGGISVDNTDQVTASLKLQFRLALCYPASMPTYMS